MTGSFYHVSMFYLLHLTYETDDTFILFIKKKIVYQIKKTITCIFSNYELFFIQIQFHKD